MYKFNFTPLKELPKDTVIKFAEPFPEYKGYILLEKPIDEVSYVLCRNNPPYFPPKINVVSKEKFFKSTHDFILEIEEKTLKETTFLIDSMSQIDNLYGKFKKPKKVKEDKKKPSYTQLHNRWGK